MAARLRTVLERRHKGCQLVGLGIRHCEEGLPIQGVREGGRHSCRRPLASHCREGEERGVVTRQHCDAGGVLYIFKLSEGQGERRARTRGGACCADVPRFCTACGEAPDQRDTSSVANSLRVDTKRAPRLARARGARRSIACFLEEGHTKNEVLLPAFVASLRSRTSFHTLAGPCATLRPCLRGIPN